MIVDLIKDIIDLAPHRDVWKEIDGLDDSEAIDYLIEERQELWQIEKDNGNPNFK